jgi:hypothetical protein
MILSFSIFGDIFLNSGLTFIRSSIFPKITTASLFAIFKPPFYIPPIPATSPPVQPPVVFLLPDAPVFCPVILRFRLLLRPFCLILCQFRPMPPVSA